MQAQFVRHNNMKRVTKNVEKSVYEGVFYGVFFYCVHLQKSINDWNYSDEESCKYGTGIMLSYVNKNKLEDENEELYQEDGTHWGNPAMMALMIIQEKI